MSKACAHLFLNLLCKLAGRSKDKADRAIARPQRWLVEAVLHHWDAEGCCFARAGLCTPQNVTAAERNRYPLRLDRSGRLVLVVRDVGVDVGVQDLRATTPELVTQLIAVTAMT